MKNKIVPKWIGIILSEHSMSVLTKLFQNVHQVDCISSA